MCFFPQFPSILAVPRPVKEGTGLCVSWGLPNGRWQPDASPGEPCDRSGFLNPGAARGKVPNSYCQARAKQGLLGAGSKRCKSQELQMNGAKKWMACVLILIPTQEAKLHYTRTPPTHTHTVFEREFSGSVTPQGLSQLDLCLCLSVCAFPSSGPSSKQLLLTARHPTLSTQKVEILRF